MLYHERDVLADAQRRDEASLLRHQIKLLDHLEQVGAADHLTLLLLRLKGSKAFWNSVVFGLVSIIPGKYLFVELQVPLDEVPVAEDIGRRLNLSVEVKLQLTLPDLADALGLSGVGHH